MPCACADEICRRGSISNIHQLTNLNKCGKFHACIRNSTILALSRLAIDLWYVFFDFSLRCHGLICGMCSSTFPCGAMGFLPWSYSKAFGIMNFGLHAHFSTQCKKRGPFSIRDKLITIFYAKIYSLYMHACMFLILLEVLLKCCKQLQSLVVFIDNKTNHNYKTKRMSFYIINTELISVQFDGKFCHNLC